MTNLATWLATLEQRHPLAIDLGLDRVNVVARRLNCTQFSCPVITVAGTNGKGSTVATLQALALAHNLNVGVYMSPHLLQFNERIAINSQSVSDAELIAAFERVDAARADVSLSYFEFTTLAALDIFKRQTLDLIVLEVGMGGRLDAVNIVDADVAVITTIAKDHEAFLGDTLEKIAAEKAGICRANHAVVIGDQYLIDLIEPAAQPYLPKVYAAGREYQWQYQNGELRWQFGEQQKHFSDVQLGPDLIAAALTAFHLIFAQRVNDECATAAVRTAKLQGRWQQIGSSPRTIVDIGHNPQAAHRLAQRARAQNKHSLRLVVGMLVDKDQAGSLAAFEGMNAHWYLCDLNGPRACLAVSLVDKLAPTEQAHTQTFASPRLAWQAALEQSAADDLILVWGSFLTVADVMLAAQSTTS